MVHPTTVSDPPQVPMMHLVLPADAERFRDTALRIASEEGIWTWGGASETGR